MFQGCWPKKHIFVFKTRTEWNGRTFCTWIQSSGLNVVTYSTEKKRKQRDEGGTKRYNKPISLVNQEQKLKAYTENKDRRKLEFLS